MTSWSSSFEYGAHSVVVYHGRGQKGEVGVRVRVRLRDSARVPGSRFWLRVSVRVQSGGCARNGGRVVGVVVTRVAVLPWDELVSFGVNAKQQILHA